MYNKVLSIFLLVLFINSAFCSKRGLGAWQWTCNQVDAFANVSWVYDWGYGGLRWWGKNCTYPKEYVAMQWGDWIAKKEELITVDQGVKYVLGFNEPDHTDQSNISPQRAATLWPQIEAAAQAGGAKLLSPAPGGGPAWLDSFLALCNGCLDRMYGIAIHCYNRDLAGLQAKINEFRKYGKPIWITEFARGWYDMPQSDQLEYMKLVIPYLESEPVVERYAWFSMEAQLTTMGGVSALMTSGSLNILGETYNSLPPSLYPPPPSPSQPPPAPVQALQPPPASVQALQPPPASVQALEPPPASVQALEPPPAPVQALQPPPAPVQALQPLHVDPPSNNDQINPIFIAVPVGATVVVVIAVVVTVLVLVPMCKKDPDSF